MTHPGRRLVQVGFYQMTKLAIIPCTVCVERIVYRKMFSLMTKASIAVLLLVGTRADTLCTARSWDARTVAARLPNAGKTVAGRIPGFLPHLTPSCVIGPAPPQGVGVATVTDLQLNLKGSVLSLLAVVTTCLAQIWTGTTQKRCASPFPSRSGHHSPRRRLQMALRDPAILLSPRPKATPS